MPTAITDRVRTGRMHAVLVLLFAVLLGACGDDDPSGPGPDDIVGTWELIDGADTTYIVITSSSVATYSDIGSCFFEAQFEIVDSEDDVYELQHESGATIEVELRRSGDDLLVDETEFEDSDFDTDDLDVCEPIALPACSTLPELVDGATIDGELDASDPVDLFDAHYELYRIELEGATTVQIDMESTEIDSYLVLYDANEDEIAFNDDRDDTTLDASLEVSLEPGCYIVMATSFEAGEIGAYTVSLSEL